MRRLVTTSMVLAAALVVIAPATAYGADLDQLLDRSQEASYTAEQVITCATPDGVRDAVVRIRQDAGEIRVATPVSSEFSVASGYGGWTLWSGGDVVDSTAVTSGGAEVDSRYTLDDGTATSFLGRASTLYQMFADGLLRAELVADDEIGALLRVATFGDDGHVYCERRFISFDPEARSSRAPAQTASEAIAPAAADTSFLPDTLRGFVRLDSYADSDGFLFAYYSDGFFSFAVFQTPAVVRLDEPATVTIGSDSYTRQFDPGQVTYSWEARSGGMALIGDVPPDMHQAILEGLPGPYKPGFIRRLWRSLFG